MISSASDIFLNGHWASLRLLFSQGETLRERDAARTLRASGHWALVGVIILANAILWCLDPRLLEEVGDLN